MSPTTWVLDLDGVVWRGDDAIVGSSDAVAALRERGDRVLFATNSALRTRSQVAAKLAHHGVPDAEDHVVTAAMAAVRLIDPGERVLVCAGPGVTDELERLGVEIVHQAPADAVVVGLTTDFDYEMLARSMSAVRGGARLVATNDDSTFPDSSGLKPGNGALVAAVERASDAAAIVAGKPYQPMADLIRDRAGGPGPGVVVGDRPDTDGRFALTLAYDFVLVLSGVTGAGDLPVEPTPRLIRDDLVSVVESWA